MLAITIVVTPGNLGLFLTVTEKETCNTFHLILKRHGNSAFSSMMIFFSFDHNLSHILPVRCFILILTLPVLCELSVSSGVYIPKTGKHGICDRQQTSQRIVGKTNIPNLS